MTQTVKQFVSFEDVTTFRAECIHCKASLTLPLGNLPFAVPQACPSCKADWYQQQSNSKRYG